MYTWMVFVHLVGVFGFLLAHGVSAAVSWGLRRQHDPAALRTMLALSASMRPLMYSSLLLLLIGGIWAGVIGEWWGHAWIWASVGLLILVTLAAVSLAFTYFRRLRRSLAAYEAAPAGGEAGQAGSALRTMLASPAPVILTIVGLSGLAAILWLMVFKPG